MFNALPQNLPRSIVPPGTIIDEFTDFPSKPLLGSIVHDPTNFDLSPEASSAIDEICKRGEYPFREKQ